MAKDVKKDLKKSKKADKSEKKRPLWQRIVGWVVSAIIAVAVLLGLLFVIQVPLFKKPAVYGYAVFYVSTWSMEPVIMKGDVIVVERVSSIDELEVGDIVTYYGKEGAMAGMIVTHRIIEIDGGMITVRGETNADKDPPFAFDQLIGRYVKISPLLTALYGFVMKWFILIVAVPLVIVLIFSIINFRRACKMDDDGKMPEEKDEEAQRAQAVKDREEELKRKAIEEYLASKKRIAEAEEEKKQEE